MAGESSPATALRIRRAASRFRRGWRRDRQRPPCCVPRRAKRAWMRWLQRWRQRLGGKSGGPGGREGATDSNGFDRARPRGGPDWGFKGFAWEPPPKNFLPRKQTQNVI